MLPISFFERAGNAYYNSIAIADADGEVLGVYRKVNRDREKERKRGMDGSSDSIWRGVVCGMCGIWDAKRFGRPTDDDLPHRMIRQSHIPDSPGYMEKVRTCIAAYPLACRVVVGGAQDRLITHACPRTPTKRSHPDRPTHTHTCTPPTKTVLLHPGGHGLQGVEDPLRHHRGRHLLGPGIGAVVLSLMLYRVQGPLSCRSCCY